jgi:hypothetical protein
MVSETLSLLEDDPVVEFVPLVDGALVGYELVLVALLVVGVIIEFG